MIDFWLQYKQINRGAKKFCVTTSRGMRKVMDSNPRHGWRMRNLGYDHHAIHTGPLIRRESVYANDTMEARKHVFNIQPVMAYISPGN